MLISLLAAVFIKDRDNIKKNSVREAYGILCGVAGFFLNMIISIGKFAAGCAAHSVALTADAVNNLTDAAGSAVTLVGFKLSGKKADAGHPFGHGRIEYIAGLVVSFFTLLAGAELLRVSFAATLAPHRSQPETAAVVVTLVSIAVKCYMAFYNNRTARKIASPALHAVAKDSVADAASTSLVLLAFGFSRFFPETDFPFDGAAGIVIAGFIIYNGIRSARDTINPLIGMPADAQFAREIERLVRSDEAVSGMHDLVVHDYGPGRVMISLHAEVPGEKSLFELHRIIDKIESNILIHTGCAATIHMDPVDLKNTEYIKAKDTLDEILRSIHTGLRFHDLQIIPEKRGTNLLFDVIKPPPSKQWNISDSELRGRIDAKVKEKLGGRYRCLIRMEEAFS